MKLTVVVVVVVVVVVKGEHRVNVVNVCNFNVIFVIVVNVYNFNVIFVKRSFLGIRSMPHTHELPLAL